MEAPQVDLSATPSRPPTQLPSESLHRLPSADAADHIGPPTPAQGVPLNRRLQAHSSRTTGTTIGSLVPSSYLYIGQSDGFVGISLANELQDLSMNEHGEAQGLPDASGNLTAGDSEDSEASTSGLISGHTRIKTKEKEKENVKGKAKDEAKDEVEDKEASE